MSQPTPVHEQEYAGQRLGLPASGPGSVAGWGRRIVALFVDWFAASLVAALIGRYVTLTADEARFLPLLVFLVEATLFTGLAGASFGQLALRIAVIRVDGRPPTILKALLRSFLICLVIPPVVFNRDNRGLHDMAADTVTVIR